MVARRGPVECFALSGRWPHMKGFACAAIVWIVSMASVSAETRMVHSQPGAADKWTALQWTADEVNRFGGMPELRLPAGRTLVLARYLYYVSNYDVARRYPVWVAHVDRADSVLKYRGRKRGDWSRANDEFMPDAQVAGQSLKRKWQFATNESFTQANPPEIPVGEKGAEKITRGHLASNAEMKSLGEPEQGLQSQAESFSLANVVPQMQRNNAPIWAKLEDNCIEWAARMGGVSVISGPVYNLDPKGPVPMNRLLYTTGRDGVGLPIPTHFFKVVIARREGRLVAVGFLVPHRTDLTPADLDAFVVPIRKIEEITGLNFMPKLGGNDALELRADERWLGWLTETAGP